VIGRRGARVPRTVTVQLPAHLGGATLHMRGEGGRDQIARDLHRDGWTGFEAPVPDVWGAWALTSAGAVLDVGANTGLYALIAAAVAPVAVHAFEPYAPVRAVLERNVAGNRNLPGTIDVRAEAVGALPGEASLYIPSDAHGLVETSCSLDPGFKDDVVSSVSVPVTTVDEHRARSGVPVGMVKIDVEGLEAEVLAGTTETLARDRPVVVLEVLPRADTAAIDRIVAAQDYLAFRLRPDAAVPETGVAFDPEAWNHLLVPAERGDDWAALSARLFPAVDKSPRSSGP
jgi:FkbM family methyltransferase